MSARKKRADSAPTEPSPDATNQSESIVPQNPAPNRSEADSRIAAQIDALRRAPRTWMLPLTALRRGEVVRIGVLDFRGLWTGQAADEITAIKAKMPGVSWVRLTPEAWSREVLR